MRRCSLGRVLAEVNTRFSFRNYGRQTIQKMAKLNNEKTSQKYNKQS